MLYLRRNNGERICAFDSRGELWIKVIEVEMDSAIVAIGPGRPDDPRTVFDVGDEMPILQGDGIVRLQAIGDWADGSHYATIGVHAPREVKIEREEMIIGMTREERARVA
jgi:sRNA-binding carbon storage regulator CsrA